MSKVQWVPWGWAAAGAVALSAVNGAAPLGVAGWMAGLGYLVVSTMLLSRGLDRSRAVRFGPANAVTAMRSARVGVVTAMVVAAVGGPASTLLFVTVTSIALALDAVDGYVARRSGTVSALGGRFDMEVDAFLLLVLSVYVGPIVGWWVLAIGLMYYGFVVAGWAIPWMRVTLPPRYWRKVVTAACGIALTIVAAGILPGPLEVIVALAAVALVVESFGRDVIWLVRSRHPVAVSAESTGPGSVHRFPSR
jgi:phosphatidylglycerophosphate synthase